MSCAAAADIDMFITNDDRLSAKVVSGVKFIASLSRAFLKALPRVNAYAPARDIPVEFAHGVVMVKIGRAR